jgi:hypothetical protein
MSLDTSVFLVQDIRKFPRVSVINEAVLPGYARRWESGMDALLANGIPFSMVHRGAIADETVEDFKMRGQWLKRNSEAIARLCRVLVVVEPDEILRELV